MAKISTKDAFSNIAYLTVEESVAGTLTFAQMAIATNLMDRKYALIIHRAEVFVADLGSLNSTGDRVSWALTISDRITDITDQSQPEVLVWGRTGRLDFGAAATGSLVEYPIMRDFSDLPGGGLLVPADRLFIGVVAVGAAAAMNVNMRLYYTVKELAVDEYWELIEARRVMTT